MQQSSHGPAHTFAGKFSYQTRVFKKISGVDPPEVKGERRM